MGSQAYMLDSVHAADECFSQVEITKSRRPETLWPGTLDALSNLKTNYPIVL